MILSQLPVDIVLEILDFVPLQTLIAILPFVSKSWAGFMKVNESSIFHYAAVRYGFSLSVDDSLESTKTKFFIQCDTHSWRSWCIRKLQIEKSWLGKSNSVCKMHKSAFDAHRIKVDEWSRYTMVTYAEGGLTTTDVTNNRVLWSLSDVKNWAHCEYSRGFMVFDRSNHQKEVWRIQRDFDLDPEPTTSPPDDRQIRSYIAANLEFRPTAYGQFRPWALLNMPQFGSAFRLVYPTLLVASQNQAFLWNVVTAQLQQVITIFTSEEIGDVFATVGRINYVDVNDRYVFVCTTHVLRVFDRTSSRLVWNLRTANDIRKPYSDTILQVGWEDTPHKTTSATVPLPLRPCSTTPRKTSSEDSFFATHVSSCGNHLSILFRSNRLLIIRDFQRLLSTNTNTNTPIPLLSEISVEIHIVNPNDTIGVTSYFAYEHNRIGLACTSGVFIISLDSPVFSQGDWSAGSISDVWPNLWVTGIKGFNDRNQLQIVSCLQLTQTGLFLAYEDEDPWVNEKRVWHVDFDRSSIM